MVRWAKRLLAVIMLFILIGTMFPFTLRSFLQWIWGALPIFILCCIWLVAPFRENKILRIIEGLCVAYLFFVLSLFGCMKWYSSREVSIEPDYILVFGAEMTADGPSPMLARRCDKAYELSKQ